MYQRSIQSPPRSVVSSGGAFNFGCYNRPFQEVNLLDAKRPYKVPLTRAVKNMQLREWQAFQMGNDSYFIMMAIYNAKKVALVQFIIYNKNTQQKLRYEQQVVPWKVTIPNGLFNTTAKYNGQNFKLSAHNDLDDNKINIRATIKKQGEDLPDLEAHFIAYHNMNRVEPMVVVMPFSDKRAMYAHKCLMPMEGQLNLGGESISFERDNAFAIIDDHKGYYPFNTHYDWVTAAGYDTKSNLLGFNLTNNQVINQELYNENCLWYNGVLNPLPPIEVTRTQGVTGDWQIADNYDMVNLQFTPLEHTSVNKNYGLFKSKYEGPYGIFNGYLKDKAGRKVEINKLFGMGEDFYLRI